MWLGVKSNSLCHPTGYGLDLYHSIPTYHILSITPIEAGEIWQHFAFGHRNGYSEPGYCVCYAREGKVYHSFFFPCVDKLLWCLCQSIPSPCMTPRAGSCAGTPPTLTMPLPFLMTTPNTVRLLCAPLACLELDGGQCWSHTLSLLAHRDGSLRVQRRRPCGYCG